jgi:hypothetical protein
VPQSEKEYVLSICEKTANDYFGITPHFKAWLSDLNLWEDVAIRLNFINR